MKLDKIRFARLIAFVQQIMPKRDSLSEEDISDIDYIIDVSVPQPDMVYPEVSDVNALMQYMAAGTQKIEAIKVHRKLTGWGLKESKELVEKYWVSKLPEPKPVCQPRAIGSDTAYDRFADVNSN